MKGKNGRNQGREVEKGEGEAESFGEKKLSYVCVPFKGTDNEGGG